MSGIGLLAGPFNGAGYKPGPAPSVEDVLEQGLRQAAASPVHLAVRGVVRTSAQREAAVRFWLVYVDAQRPVEELREHRASFGYPFGALRDVDGSLVALAGATVTPEAAVFDAEQRMVYRGRIDDRFVSFGVARRAPRTRDLHDRLSRIAGGETLAFSETRAVGCYIPGA